MAEFTTTVLVYIIIGSIVGLCFIISLAYYCVKHFIESKEDKRMSNMSTQDFFPVNSISSVTVPKTGNINHYKSPPPQSLSKKFEQGQIIETQENPFAHQVNKTYSETYIAKPEQARYSSDKMDDYSESSYSGVTEYSDKYIV